MAQRSVQSRIASLSTQQRKRISKMAVSGSSIGEIAKRYQLDYGVVQSVLWEEGTLPWQGAKSLITRRLRSLGGAGKTKDRAALIKDIQEQVDYIYYAARRLQAQRDSVKKIVS